MRDILLVLIGGACSASGGFLAAWYRARIAGEVKLQETIAQGKVAAYGKGLEFIGQLQSVLIQGTDKDALDFLYDKGGWFADNLILLPHTFVENWRSIRLHLQSVIRKDTSQERKQDGEERNRLIDEIGNLKSFCRELARDAENSIRNELNLPECKIQHPQNSKPTQR